MTPSDQIPEGVHPGLEASADAATQAPCPALPLTETGWTRWADRRPEDHSIPYRWRIGPRQICGMALRAEWTEKLALCGRGYDDPEWWPVTSDWNGYTRTVPADLEWRPALEGETDPAYGGLDLLPDPWTGKPPHVKGNTRYIGAPPYKIDAFALCSAWGTSYGWTDAKKMAERWNKRVLPTNTPPLSDGAGLMRSRFEGDPDADPSQWQQLNGTKIAKLTNTVTASDGVGHGTTSNADAGQTSGRPNQ